MSVQTTYNTWYIRADQAWTMLEDLENEQALLDIQTEEDSLRYDEIELEMQHCKEDAEFAEKKMEQMENCMNVRLPNPLFIPGTSEEIVRNEIFS